MIQRIQNISNYFLTGLIPLILLMFINASVNKHVHILPTGEIVVHAHPFQKANGNVPVKKHTHTDKELQILALISNPLSLLAIIFLGFSAFLNNKGEEIFYFVSEHTRFEHLQSKRNKAPPVLIS